MARPCHFGANEQKNMPDQFELHQFARRGLTSASVDVDGAHALVAESDLEPSGARRPPPASPQVTKMKPPPVLCAGR